MLIRGESLNEAQRVIVLDAFGNRFTHENIERATRWLARLGGSAGIPKAAQESDAEWLSDHAFHFTKDGARLMKTRRYAEPAALT